MTRGVARNSPLEKGAAPKERELCYEAGKAKGRLNTSHTEAGLPALCHDNPGRLATYVASRLPPLIKAECSLKVEPSKFVASSNPE